MPQCGRCRSTQTHNWRPSRKVWQSFFEEHARRTTGGWNSSMCKDKASPPSVVCRKSPLPLASDSPWSAQRLQQSPSGTGTTALPTIVSGRRGDPPHGAHEVPCSGWHLSTSSGCVLPTSCAAMHRAGRPHPVLCGLVGTLRAFGALSHHLRLHHAFDREGEGGACCCIHPESAHVESHFAADEAFECCWSVHRRGSSAHVLSSQSFALRHVVPLTEYLNIPLGAKVLQGIIPDFG